MTTATSTTERPRRIPAIPDSAAFFWSIPATARYLGLGVTSTFHLVKEGKLPSAKLGRRVLIPKDAVLAFADGLMAGAADTTSAVR